MPYYSWVKSELKCPNCGSVLDDLVWFTWAGVRSPNATLGPRYRLGDRLLWFVTNDGVAPADGYFADGQAANVGDPLN